MKKNHNAFIHIISFIKKLIKKLDDNKIGIYSAQSAFFIIIAFFPTIMLLLTLLNYLPFSAEQIEDFSMDFLPPQVETFIESLLDEIFQKASGAVISVATVTALWSASRGLLAVITGLNSIYGVEEKRNYIKLRLITMLYMLAFMATLIITLIILVFGSAIASRLIDSVPALRNADLFLTWTRWLFGFCLLILFFWALYSFAPGRKTSSIMEFPGAIISAGGWVGFSALYSFYITNFANYSYLYGSLTAVVLLMLWLYICMNILFFGAQVNVIIRKEYEKHKRKKPIKANIRRV
ncbi:MAG: YihY/virulence factor BrkB family protein [Oscillospiraceae bacterium]|nr:YihY/virulence factor BrkB family protein [Oscillospiraceae bacterium]